MRDQAQEADGACDCWLGGLVTGVSLAFIIELIDQTVRTQEDVENKLGLPFLGQIPLSADDKGKICRPSLPKNFPDEQAMRNAPW